MGNAYNETMQILKKHRITANKSLGQNFLINDEIIDRIIEGAEIQKNDLVIEIGPGLGTLTSRLLQKAGKVLAIEIDNRMVNILKGRFENVQNLEIIQEDVLKVDLKKKIQEEGFKAAKVVANLPYYITTPIIMKLLEEDLNLESITVMVQKEVADRLATKPGEKNCGAITYAVYYYSEAQKLIEVPKESFIPSPEVTSEIIKLNIRDQAPVNVKNKEMLFKIIKAAFMQRRKTISNSLMNTSFWKDKQELIKTLDKLQISPKARAEELTLEQFVNIVNEIDNN